MWKITLKVSDSDNLFIVSEARNAQVMFEEKQQMKINSFYKLKHGCINHT